MIVSLQTLVSREIDPIEPAVVTVGSIHGGTKHNIDSRRVPLAAHGAQLHRRSARAKLLDGIRRKAEAVAAGAGAPKPTVEVLEEEITPALFNDENWSNASCPSFSVLSGEDNVVASEPAMGGEDFSRYGLAGVPIFMFRLGSVDAQRLAGLTPDGEPPSLHSAMYFPDAESTLETGITAMTTAVLDLLPPKK